MADMDSAGAANRQNPGSLARNTGRPTVVRRRVATPKKKVTVKKTPLRSTRSTSSSRGGNSNFNRNQGQNQRRAVNRRITSNSGKKRSTPKPPAKPDSKIITPPAPPKPVIPDIKKFIAGDSVYQKQLAAFNKSLADFQADQGLASTDFTTNFTNTSRDIGLAKQEAAGDLEEDYASRGLLKSGLYNTALGDLNSQYQNQFNDLNSQKTAFLSQLAQELKKYQNEQGVQKGNAYNDAVRRRAEQYNL